VVAGLVVLALFVAWERRLTGLPGGQPLIDLSLFHSRSFTWGVLLTSVGIFGLFGVLFGLPQYFQAIMGVDPQGSGFRLLPAVVGLLVGAVTADRVNVRIGAKLTVALGFAVVVVGSLVGATMTATSGDGFIAGWTFIVGLGGGMGFATAASAALVELTPDRSGVGAALLQAVVKLGPAFGASFLGSILNSTYQAQVAVAGLPDSAAAAVKASVFGGLSVAQQVGSAALLDSVRAAFVAGMDDAVRVTAGVAIVGIVLALLFLPARARAARLVEAPGATTGHVTVR
jgi:predicted MFS family arabinose efflux permease